MHIVTYSHGKEIICDYTITYFLVTGNLGICVLSFFPSVNNDVLYILGEKSLHIHIINCAVNSHR